MEGVPPPNPWLAVGSVCLMTVVCLVCMAGAVVLQVA